MDTFDDLRPYYDGEINAAMHRIADSEHLPRLVSYVYPERDPDDVRQQLRSYVCIEDFQLQVMRAVNEQVITKSISSFLFEGFDRLDRNRRYLFVSNHRDIVLDAMLLQYALFLSGHPTSEISFGDNLMSSQIVIDIGKSNKMFKVIRSRSAKEFYANSLRLSQYIRHTITEKRESVWIAQRNGRTKDGCDATEQGIVKLFCMSSSQEPISALAALNIVPVAISYQWESCDILKTKELCSLQRNGTYVKKPGEDINSILTGIMQPKGAVTIVAGEPLTAEMLAPLAGQPGTRVNKAVATLIDAQIHRNYRLTCNNYIACDMLSGRTDFADHYTPEEKARFESHFRHALAANTDGHDTFAEIFLGIYANPVRSKAAQE